MSGSAFPPTRSDRSLGAASNQDYSGGYCYLRHVCISNGLMGQTYSNCLHWVAAVISMRGPSSSSGVTVWKQDADALGQHSRKPPLNNDECSKHSENSKKHSQKRIILICSELFRHIPAFRSDVTLSVVPSVMSHGFVRFDTGSWIWLINIGSFK